MKNPSHINFTWKEKFYPHKLLSQSSILKQCYSLTFFLHLEIKMFEENQFLLKNDWQFDHLNIWSKFKLSLKKQVKFHIQWNKIQKSSEELFEQVFLIEWSKNLSKTQHRLLQRTNQKDKKGTGLSMHGDQNQSAWIQSYSLQLVKTSTQRIVTWSLNSS